MIPSGQHVGLWGTDGGVFITWYKVIARAGMIICNATSGGRVFITQTAHHPIGSYSNAPLSWKNNLNHGEGWSREFGSSFGLL
jgi:hypothetical protein